MSTNEFTDIKAVKDFTSLIKYLRKSLNWPVDEEQVDDLTFDYRAAELGIDERLAVKVKEIKQLRPLMATQPWGVFWIQFEQKQLPVVVMRRILSALVKKQRGQRSHQKTWDLLDLMFISAIGEGNERGILFAHFQEVDGKPQLRTFAWDVKETHLYYIKNLNLNSLRWPTDNGRDIGAWRSQWSEAFTVAHRYVPTTAEMLAKKMAQIASYIREAVKTIYRMEHPGRGSLHKLYFNLKLDLISDLSEDDFADMYAQTVTYGLFAARATRSGDFKSTDTTALIEHTNPFLRELLEQMMNQQLIDLDELGVTELTELLAKVNMEAILQSFGKQKRGEDPVIHFYETFMKEYDPAQKTKRGEFYTPDAVVSFIVRSVDHLLRTEFDCADGLATAAANAQGFKPVILDPATGTGTFLKYVIEVIWETFYEKNKRLSNKDRREKWNCFVREDILPRLYAFELKMSPYTIAHMKVGLALQEKGFDFDDNERLQIYLSNALQPAHEVARVDTAALAHESEQANEVKNKAPITIIMGNPPYSNFGRMNKGHWITELLGEYKKDLNEKKINIEDDYIKFIRLGQWRIDKTGTGILAFITNNSFIDGITHRQMRKSLLNTFSEIYILDLHGSTKKQEKSPDGSKDENVFDIQQGVSINIFVKTKCQQKCRVFHADLWGSRETKYSELLIGRFDSKKWEEINPVAPHFFFTPKNLTEDSEYQTWLGLKEIFGFSAGGLETMNDKLTVAFDKSEIENVVSLLKSKPRSVFKKSYDVQDSAGWNLEKAFIDVNSYDKPSKLVRPITYRPFDFRWTYYSGNQGFMSRPRLELFQNLIESGNVALCALRQSRAGEEPAFYVVDGLAGKDIVSLLDRGTVFPLYLVHDKSETPMLIPTDKFRTNFTKPFISKLEKTLNLKFSDDGKTQQSLYSYDVFCYLYAVFHSSTYRSRYAEFLKIDFPRLPLTSKIELFRQLCGLGKELVAFHLLEAPVLNKPITKFKGQGDNVVAKGYPKYQDGAVLINLAQCFEGVPEEVWEFHIGGYQVCEKWLKDRRGRELSAEDIVHYQKIVVALKETIRLMKEVDDVIEVHGGWPIK